ncbi:hypothetical protein ACM46_18885 [Chryseobacterium angstadtii]|uniref:Uncharacterized protein n=1 Tax=Chryseobacterium angstadtii TaxID=558151 RepID=A0A0J7I1W0_9FLAO|nr:hypothetical protein [Chryseobacterium angstadtii]KMQ60272.1 hypothetical protein ACM46_18885 [Chryseobacterium angstadtii]
MKKTSIKDHGNLLKVFMILLNYDAIRRDIIMLWADSVLASEEESEYPFIELSTSNNTLDTIQILNRNSTHADSEITSRAVLGILYHMLQEEKVALKTAFEVATSISYEKQLTDAEQFLLYRFDEYIELGLHETNEKLRLFNTHFVDLLRVYQDFRLENHSNWPIINEKMKMGLEIQLETVRKKYPYY